MRRRATLAALTAGLTWLSGCGQPEYVQLPVVPAEGVVLFQGKPPAGADVTFLPLNDNSPDAVKPRGKVAADGSYRLATYPTADGKPDGAPPGEYRVAIRWPTRPARLTDGDEGGGPPGAPGLQGDRLRDRYSRPDKSGLTARVEAGKPIETIRLK